MKVILGYLVEGLEVEFISIVIVDGKIYMFKVFFVVYDGVKIDLLFKVKVGIIKIKKGEYVVFDVVYIVEDGLKGGGSWVFVMDSGNIKDLGFMFNLVEKLIIMKDLVGLDYN